MQAEHVTFSLQKEQHEIVLEAFDIQMSHGLLFLCVMHAISREITYMKIKFSRNS